MTVYVTVTRKRNPDIVTFSSAKMGLMNPHPRLGISSNLAACIATVGQQRGGKLLRSGATTVELAYENEFYGTIFEQFIKNICDEVKNMGFDVHFER